MTQDARSDQDGVPDPSARSDSGQSDSDQSATAQEENGLDQGAEATDDTGQAPESGATAQFRPRRQRHPVGRFVREVLLIGGAALLISFLIKTFLVQAFWIPSGSMENTLIYGDRVLVSKIQAGPMSVERGDIIVFEDPGGWLPPATESDRGPVLNAVRDAATFVGILPEGDSSHLIKRVVGVGGDHIECCDEQLRLMVNGESLDETYLFPGDDPSQESFDITVPDDHYWMMGDHRSFSRDSRAHDDGSGEDGSIPADHVVGKAFVLVWPLDRLGTFGDGDEVFSGVPEEAP